MDLSFLRDKKVLVTGGSGFVGRNFAETLLKTGAKLRITLHNRPSPFGPALADTIQPDLTVAKQCLAACEGMDYVIHAAGSVGNAGNIRSNLISPIVDNLVITARLMEAASVHCEKMLVFSSSTAGYPNYTHPVCEDEMWSAQPAPVYFGYGWMRRYFELLGEYASSVSSLKVLVCRPTAVYGRYDSSGHVIPSLIRRALAGESPLVVWGSGAEKRDFLEVRDLVRGCLLLLDRGEVSDPVNIGYGKTSSIAEVAGMVLRAAGRSETDLVFDDAKPTTIPVRAVDCSKAEAVLGFRAEIPLATGISEAVQWFRSNQ
jgi:GDP-L-fucose synthase